MTNKTVFRFIYGIILAAVLVFTDYTIVALQDKIDEYEASQPEHVVDEAVARLCNMAREGKLREVMIFPEIATNSFENEQYLDQIYKEYEKRMAGAEEWTWKLLSGSYSTVEQTYGVFCDGELSAKIKLNCLDSRIIIEILTVNTWTAGDIYPVITLSQYNYCIEIPEDFSVTVNDLLVSEKYGDVSITEKDGNKIYRVNGFFEEPAIKIYDRYGDICEAVNEEGYVTAKLSEYNLILPDNMYLLDNGNRVKGVRAENGMLYSFASSHDKITIADEYGNEKEFRNGDSIKIHNVSFVVPENYRVEWGANDISKFIGKVEHNPAYVYCEEMVEMPKLVTYEIGGLADLPKLDIIDNLGNKVKYEFVNNYFEITKQAELPSVPTNVIEEADPLNIAKIWSLFNTNDLTGSNHGLATIKKYIVPNTYLYDKTVAFATGPDIGFASMHNTPVFVEERMTNFVKYSDNLFSCDIYLNKEMYVTVSQYTGNVYDVINSTFYFYKYNGTWRILDFTEKVEK